MSDTVVIRENKAKPFNKHLGRHPDVVDTKDDGVVHYVAFNKSFQIFRDDSTAIEFDRAQYFTNDKDEIKYLESHKAFNRRFWKDKYPQHILNKFKDDAKYLTNMEDDFIPAEA